MSIVLDRVRKSFGTQPIVRDISLNIEAGELFVLLGASGSGKSTLLRLIAGLIEVDAGRISLDGRDVTHLPPQQRGTGFVFQNYSLFRHMSVAQNIEFGLEMRGVKRSERITRVDELLELIGLPKYGQRLPSQLSGGQQQRVALARAIAPNPSVLLLDEPFGALDVKIRAQLRQNLREVQQRLGITTILVTHDQEEAFELADRIAIIENGQIVEVGTPDALYRRPQSRFTATFVGQANLLPAQRNGSHVYLEDGSQLPAPADTEHLHNQQVHVLARPEEIELTLAQDDAQGSIIGKGILQNLAFAGHVLRATVELTGITGETRILQALVTPAQAREQGLIPGSQVWVSLREFHLIPESSALPLS
jgi:sulfate/thiosulfate transport system ATP-binding protein